MYKELIPGLIDIVRKAGNKILEIYDSPDFDVEYKDDNSPLTRADKASNDIILKRLAELTPGIPVISEEKRAMPFEERKDLERFWVVDPLDGTKEFIKRNGEFTINIGLIEDGAPVLGIISIPVKKHIYYGIKDLGAVYFEEPDVTRDIKAKEKYDAQDILKAAVSRSHLSGQDEKVIDLLGAETIAAGSALKFTLVAEGKADVYLRFGPTWEWDTAAGHAIAEAAGACVCDLKGDKLSYNKEVLKHGGFFVCSKSIKDKIAKAVAEA
jgi:3'(2'), 5'-bisphosphate nucleotidase